MQLEMVEGDATTCNTGVFGRVSRFLVVFLTRAMSMMLHVAVLA
jgi:hypothetical protein